MRGYSLGMRQRLGLAGVLLGDPHTVILDEPANGLDPEGIRWIRDVLVHLARQGKTVLVSSHLLSEIALMADDLVVIGRGRLIEQGPVSQFIDRHADRWVRVRTPDPAPFAEQLRAAGATYEPVAPDGIEVYGLPIERVGELAAPQRRRAPRAVAAELVAGGRLPQGDGRRPGVPVGRPVVIDAIRSEWIKVSTVTVTWVLAIIAVAFPLVVTILTTAFADEFWDGEDLAGLVGGLVIVTSMLLGVVATIAVTNEFAHNTIRPTFAAMPDRLRPLLAKPIVQVDDHVRADRRHGRRVLAARGRRCPATRPTSARAPRCRRSSGWSCSPSVWRCSATGSGC